MIKKLHYIKENNSSDIEKITLASLKSHYPDFEYSAWMPGSSPLRILYDNGGLFIGPNILSVSRIPDSFFEKDFFAFSPLFDDKQVNTNICYANKEKSPLFLSLMENGLSSLNEEITSSPFKPFFSEEDLSLPSLNIYNKNQFGFINTPDNTYRNISPFLLNINVKSHLAPTNLHYLVIDKKSDPTKVFSLCENFAKLESKEDHFLLLVCNDISSDLTSKMGEFLNYHIVYEGKSWDTLFLNGLDESSLSKVLVEYISRNFRPLSCERLPS